MQTEVSNSIAVRGNATLVVDRPRTCWLVESGQVAVFRARIRDGAAVGPRRYCCGCQPGHAIFGDPGIASSDRYRFLAVGIADSRLTPLTAADLERLLRETPDQAANLVETWVEKLGSFLGREQPDHSVSGAGDDTGPIRLESGQTFRPPWRSTCWVCIDEGSVQLLGLPELVLPTGPVPFPLGSEAWFKAAGPVTLRVLRTVDVPSADSLLQGLELLHARFLSYLKVLDRREAMQEELRLGERERQEKEATADALDQLRDVLSPRTIAPSLPGGAQLKSVLAAIGRQLQVKFEEPGRGENLNRAIDPLEAVARASHVRMRHVRLRGEWWKSDCGPLLAYLDDDRNRPVALLRNTWGRYEIFDPQSSGLQPLTPESRARLADQAIMFYRPFPEGPLNAFQLPVFASRLYWRELAIIVLISGATTLLGMALPQATRWIIDYAIPDADGRALWEFALVLLAVNCGQAAFQLAEGIVMLRMQTATTGMLQSAAFDRLLRLPARFFHGFTSGDLLNRTMMITEISNELGATTMRSVLGGGMSVLYLGLLFYYSPQLAMLGIVVAILCSVVTVWLSTSIRRVALKLEQLSSQLFGFVVQALSGIAKLRVAGAERRAFNHWTRRYVEQLRLTARARLLQDASQLFSIALPTLFTIVLYFMAMSQLTATDGKEQPLTMGSFLAFFTAFGIFVRGATSFSQGLVQIMDSLAKQRMVQPILEAALEFEVTRADPGRLEGRVAVDNAVFRYRDDGPLILDGVSLHAEAGEFIALVGPSGSGKSTLLRLLLGFDAPSAGAVLYDGKNLGGLNLTAVRRQIGVVLQSARITAASLFDNIASGNRILLEEAWQACRDAGMADDIEQMPMGLHTVVTEGGGNLSGGQRQRLLIARALVLNPRVLMFDEATSALDNRTQAIVSRSLEHRKVTRIVVAHRLSTIRHADRIYVLEKGKIAQAGTFDELTQQDGLFQRMMQRQQV
ncbi:MAG: NHLP bacteriocin export ABC transporter permease/ATPase subunit [Gemmataceae bacterium]|nr:NHLP bacteriocin export ABC transporter permease/ATPase subunit [Gemmataceae bacterium]